MKVFSVYCSNKDTKWVSDVLRRNKWSPGTKLFDLKKDEEFRLCVPQRDFGLGVEYRNGVGQEWREVEELYLLCPGKK